MTDTIQQFVQELITSAGLEQAPEDIRKACAERLAITVHQKLGVMALKELNEQDLNNFEKLIDQDNAPESKAAWEFFNKRIPNFQKKVEATLQQLAQEFIQAAVNLRE